MSDASALVDAPAQVDADPGREVADRTAPADDALARGERAFEEAAHEAHERGPFVGFVGCSRSGRVLRVRVASRLRHRLRVECPHGCGEHATAAPMARALLKGERPPKLTELPPADAPTSPAGDNPAPADPDDPTALRGRQQVSDAAILEAIGEQDSPAMEIARALGYEGTSADPLVKRCLRRNQRAAAKDEKPPFVVTTRRGCPTLLRRAES